MDSSIGTTRATCDTKILPKPSTDTVRSVIELTSLMTIVPGTKILVACKHPIKIGLPFDQYHFVSASAPIELIARLETMTIQPHCDLGPIFAGLWRELPPELKLEVLGHHLTSHEPYITYEDGGRSTALNALHHYLTLGPDIAPLALEVYYKTNVFCVDLPGCGRIVNAVPALPRLALRPFIRKLWLRVDMTDSDGFTALKKLQNGRYCFPSLQHITVELMWYWHARDHPTFACVFEYARELKIRFKWSGKMVISEDELRLGMCSVTGWTIGQFRQELESLIEFDRT
jgi:hypothetical protein